MLSSGLRSSQSRLLNSHTELVCEICYIQFNKSSRIPLIICHQEHQMCSYCVQVIRKNKKCPFCRQALDFSKIKVNKQLVRRLTDDPSQPNVRHEILQQSNFYIQPASSEANESNNNEDFFEQFMDQPGNRLHSIIEDTQRKRKTIYLVTIFFVLPFFITDFYFGFLDVPQLQCNTKKLFGLMNLRSWLIAISIIQAVSLMVFLFALINNKCSRREYDRIALNVLEEVYSQGIVVKGLICCIVELFLFFAIIVSSCRGPIYAYGIVLAIIHMLKVVMIALGIVKNTCC